MKNKSLWRILALTSREAEDAVAELFGGIFNRAVSVCFDFEKNESRVAAFVYNKISREAREELRAGLKRIENCGLKIGAAKIFVSKIRREDWANSWKRHFRPIEIGDSLLIKPGWSKKRPRKKQTAVVIIDPGLSFGTGQHPTTLFCLRQIARASKNAAMARKDDCPVEKSFLDVGSGSGILAIAAAKLGYGPVHAIDFDPEAVRVTKANARANGVLGKIEIVRGDVSKFKTKPKKQFDVICANLISNLLIAERKKIAAQLRRSGNLVLAGILKSEFSEVEKAFEDCGLKLVAAKMENEWRSGLFHFA